MFSYASEQGEAVRGKPAPTRKAFKQDGNGDHNRTQMSSGNLVFINLESLFQVRLYLNLSSERDINSCFSYKFLMHFHY